MLHKTQLCKIHSSKYDTQGISIIGAHIKPHCVGKRRETHAMTKTAQPLCLADARSKENANCLIQNKYKSQSSHSFDVSILKGVCTCACEVEGKYQWNLC